MIRAHLGQLAADRRLRELDFHFADYLTRITGQESDELLLAAALVSRATGEGHVCLDLASVAGKPVLDDPQFLAPALEPWCAALRASSAVGAPGEAAPLILDERARLYLARYFHFEQSIVQALQRRAVPEPVDTARARDGLARLFFSLGGDDPQQRAAAVALSRRLAVISGGPGTGKTTTVTRLLALLIEQHWPSVPRIALAAPTGKAAARLCESIRHAKQALACDGAVRDAIVDTASTLHRLLRVVPGETGFRHHARNPLHVDVLVVDEASMIDVPLMARLLDALPAKARLILLGDRDQLASVEAGSVLGDLCDRGAERHYSNALCAQLSSLGVTTDMSGDGGPAMADSLVALTQSHRFGAHSGIGHLARAINKGDAPGAFAILEAPDCPDVSWQDMNGAALAGVLATAAVAAFRAYLACQKDPHEAMARFNAFRFLCALRDGPFGVEAINERIEAALRAAGFIHGRERYYAGRPIMIARNDYTLGLFNGDVGLILPDTQADGRLRAFFATPQGELRRVLLSRLPAHETVYAMTVHKSQGSEFDKCVLVLPDTDSPVLTRELLYTAITRARRDAALWGTREIFARAVTRRVERRSGLRDGLWEVR